jgi:hypothetical protein
MAEDSIDFMSLKVCENAQKRKVGKLTDFMISAKLIVLSTPGMENTRLTPSTRSNSLRRLTLSKNSQLPQGYTLTVLLYRSRRMDLHGENVIKPIELSRVLENFWPKE